MCENINFLCLKNGPCVFRSVRCIKNLARKFISNFENKMHRKIKTLLCPLKYIALWGRTDQNILQNVIWVQSNGPFIHRTKQDLLYWYENVQLTIMKINLKYIPWHQRDYFHFWVNICIFHLCEGNWMFSRLHIHYTFWGIFYEC